MEPIQTEYQQIIYGIEHLAPLLSQLGAKHVMMVADSSFKLLNIHQQICSIPTQYTLFDGFTANPLYEDVCRGVELFNASGCDTLTAVGGGSSIDVAKCIKLYCRMNPEVNYLQQPCIDTQIPLVAIPTTAGTGSESTRFAVIYYEGKKQSVNHLSIIPNYAILEPEVLSTLPLYQKKCTVLDALCQGIESWWSVNSTPESRVISQKAVSLLANNIEPYLFGSADEPKTRRLIMTAANLAGQAINITQTTAAHAFSYKVTSLYKLPHGHAVAACLPEIWRYMLAHKEKCLDTRGAQYLSDTFQAIAEAMNCQSAEEAILWFTHLMEKMEMPQPQSLQRDQDLTILSSSVNPVRLKNNPIELDENTIRSLYNNILK